MPTWQYQSGYLCYYCANTIRIKQYYHIYYVQIINNVDIGCVNTEYLRRKIDILGLYYLPILLNKNDRIYKGSRKKSIFFSGQANKRGG